MHNEFLTAYNALRLIFLEDYWERTYSLGCTEVLEVPLQIYSTVERGEWSG